MRSDTGDGSGPRTHERSPQDTVSALPVSPAIADRLREMVVLVENLEADAGNDAAYVASSKLAKRELRALFGEFGIDAGLHWPAWIAAIRARLEQLEATAWLRQIARSAAAALEDGTRKVQSDALSSILAIAELGINHPTAFAQTIEARRVETPKAAPCEARERDGEADAP